MNVNYTDVGTVASQSGSEKADHRRSFHQIHGARLCKLKQCAAGAELRLNKYAGDLGWLITQTAGEQDPFPEVLECFKCSARDGKLVIDDVPVYFIWDIEAESYVEAQELYGPMQKPESKKLQELLAAGASLRRRFRRFEEEQRQKEAGHEQRKRIS
ncbi:MAG: hypothetical protein ABSG73_01315 [Candidatus Aminicenantales bacterium]|jgi:hypothetical protein